MFRRLFGNEPVADARFRTLIEHLKIQSIATRRSLVGCTPEEIEILENRYDIKLPASYRTYLEIMGHKSGRLFTHDHMHVFYRHVLEMTA